MPVQTYRVSSQCWSKQRSACQRTLHVDAILLFMPPYIELRGNWGGSYTKIEDPLDEELSPFRIEQASKKARWTPQDIHDSDDITPLALHPEEEVKTLEGRILHWWHPKAPPRFLPVPRLKKRFSQDKSDKIQPGMKAIRHERWWWNQVHLHCCPGQSPSYLIRYQEKKTQSTKLRVNLARLDIRQANQAKERALPTFPGSKILSQKLILCDKIIVKIDVLCQLSPPSSSFSFSFIRGRRRRRRTSLSIRTRSLGQGILEKIGRLLPGIHHIYRWRYQIVFYANSQPPRAVGSCPVIYGMLD